MINIKRHVLLLLLFSVIGVTMTDCVNSIQEETDGIEINSSQEDAGIKFVVSLGSNSMTQSGNFLFKAENHFGMYATIPPETLKGHRYLNNVKLTTQSDKTLTSSIPIKFPENNQSISFICYYPYTAQAIDEGSSLLPVTILKDQSTSTAINKSIFLAASASNVENGTDDISLNFKNKLCKIKLMLNPENADEVEKVIEEQPSIVAVGFYTQAQYDLDKDKITDFSNIKNIIPYGTWQSSTDASYATGKEFIATPQAINQDYQYLSLEYHGNLRSCELKNVTQLESGKEYTFSIRIPSNAKEEVECFLTGYTDWEPEPLKETDYLKPNQAIALDNLTFNTSNIYRVYSAGYPIAEICKEYLGAEVNEVVTTIYPLTNNQTTDLSKGLIINSTNSESQLIGAKISWDETANTFTTTGGNQAISENIFLDENKEFTFERPATPQTVAVKIHCLEDIRDNTLTEYPIVKVGAQYWMRSDLKATNFTDGTPLSHITTGLGAIGYYQQDDIEHIFYSGETVLHADLAPVGWEIPSKEDWMSLRSYLANDAAKMKAGEWKAVDNEKTATEVNNLSGLYIYANGGWGDTDIKLTGKMAGYWSYNPEVTDDDPLDQFTLQGEKNTLSNESGTHSNQQNEYYKACQLRCILKR